MVYDLLSFSQRVPKSGHEVVARMQSADQNGESRGEELFLVESRPSHGRKLYSHVNPLQREDRRPLFWRFAALATAEDMIGFANEFGLLGGDFRQSIWTSGLVPKGKGKSYVIGESTSNWMREIHTMRHATELWRLAASQQEESTESYLLEQCRLAASQTEDAHELLPSILRRIIQGEGDSQHPTTKDAICGNLKEMLRRGRTATSIAMSCVVRVINMSLTQAVNVELVWEEKDDRGQVQRPQLDLAPTALYQMIWLEFALAVGGQRGYMECAHCGGLFGVPISRVGRPSVYCSDACRMKAYRRRKTEARTLS